MGQRRTHLQPVKTDDTSDSTYNPYEIILQDSSGERYVFECNEMGLNPEVSESLIFFYHRGVDGPVFVISIDNFHSLQQRRRGREWPVKSLSFVPDLNGPLPDPSPKGE